MRTFLGLDLTQHQPVVCRTNEKVKPEFLNTDYPNVVLLPFHKDEPLIVGQSAAEHRRGKGLFWPMESQAPILGEPQRGVGCIPLWMAWMSLLPSVDESESLGRKLEPYKFSWKPEGETISVSSVDLIIASVLAYIEADDEKVGLVIPEGFDEVRQQVLLDAWRAQQPEGKLFLIPRTMAAACSWCCRNSSSELKQLRVSTTSLDQWESSVVTLEHIDRNGQKYVVPVHDNTRGNCAINCYGNGLLDFDSWKDLINGEFRFGIDCKTSELVKKLEKPCNVEKYFGITPWEKVTAQNQAPTKSLPIEQKGNQGHFLDPEPTVVTGWASAISDQNIFLMEKLNNIFPDNPKKMDLSNHVTANGLGAAYIVKQMALGLPSYKCKISQLGIQAARFTELMYKERYEEILIKEQTIHAGEDSLESKPIEKFSIEANSPGLNLILVRNGVKGSTFTKIEKTSEKRESVIITATQRPGQGYAKVSIRSKEPGVFDRLLDWSTLDKTPVERDALKMGWEPIVLIKPDPARSRNAQNCLELLYNGINSKHLDDLRKALTPSANYIERKQNNNTILIRIGVYPNVCGEARLSSVFQHEIFINILNRIFEKGGDQADRAINAGAYMYYDIPDHYLDRVREQLIQGELPREYRAAVGNCFRKKEDIQLFIQKYIQKIESQSEALNNWNMAFKWLAWNCCDLFNPKLMSDADFGKLKKLVIENLFNLLTDPSRSLQPQILKNQLYVMASLLRRRFFDPSSLLLGSEVCEEMKNCLNTIKDNATKNFKNKNFKLYTNLEFLIPKKPIQNIPFPISLHNYAHYVIKLIDEKASVDDLIANN